MKIALLIILGVIYTARAGARDNSRLIDTELVLYPDLGKDITARLDICDGNQVVDNITVDPKTPHNILGKIDDDREFVLRVVFTDPGDFSTEQATFVMLKDRPFKTRLFAKRRSDIWYEKVYNTNNSTEALRSAVQFIDSPDQAYETFRKIAKNSGNSFDQKAKAYDDLFNSTFFSSLPDVKKKISCRERFDMFLEFVHFNNLTLPVQQFADRIAHDPKDHVSVAWAKFVKDCSAIYPNVLANKGTEYDFTVDSIVSDVNIIKGI